MKSFTLLIALFISITLNAQDYPGKRTELLLGKKIIVKPLSESERPLGYRFFFTDEKFLDAYEPAGASRISTRPEALVGKTFEVLSVDPIEKFGKKYDKLTLKDDNGLVLYHLHEDKGPEYFIFTVEGGLDYPDDFFCDFIKEKADTENGTTDYIIEPYDGLSLTKVKGKDITGYLLQASLINATLDTATGVTFILDNGAKITRASLTPLKSISYSGDYKYTRLIELTEQEIELLKSHTITHFQLGNFKEDVSWGSKLIKDALPCLMTK